MRSIVLLHAFPLCGEMYRAQTEALRGRFTVLTPTFPGFGKTPPGSGPSLMSTLAQGVFAAMDQAGVARATVCGTSMGGYVAMAMLRHDAGRVEGLVLAGTHPLADDEAIRAGRRRQAVDIEQRGLPALVASMMPRLVAPNAPAKVRDEVERLFLAGTPHGAIAALEGMALRPDSADVLSRYAGPALVVRGEHDAFVSAERAQALAALMPGARLAAIPGIGHLAPLEAPEAFNQLLLDFL